jgi:hypothetical protein
MAVTPLVVVLLSFAHINFGPLVVFDRKGFGVIHEGSPDKNGIF